MTLLSSIRFDLILLATCYYFHVLLLSISPQNHGFVEGIEEYKIQANLICTTGDDPPRGMPTAKIMTCMK